MLFRTLPGNAAGIATYVGAGLGVRLGATASWALLLCYGANLLAWLLFLGFFLQQLLQQIGW